MKKFLNIFFVVLGVIFFILLVLATYFFITDPFNLKPLVFDSSDSEYISSKETIDKNLLISDTQEKLLETVGVDPADLPTEITPTMHECFVGILGAERVFEIEQGSSPTPTEFFKTKHCLN